MALSPNYGWTEPDNTGLVKNGAQDMRTLGDAIDTSVWNVGFGQAGKNKIINGDFGIWQRGTSFSNPVNGSYNADRWLVLYDGTGSTRSVTRQTFTPGTSPTGYEAQYFLRYNQSVAGSGATYSVLETKLEDVRTFAGQTVTVSFWAKSSTTTTPPFLPYIWQNFGSGGSSPGVVVSTPVSNPNLSSSWQRYTYTATVPSISGKTVGAGSFIYLDITMPINTTFTIDIWGVQLEYGSKATPFQTASGGSPQAELAMCQRYFQIIGNTVLNENIATGQCVSTTAGYSVVPLKVTMRTAPSVSFGSQTTFYMTTSTYSLLSTTQMIANVLGANTLQIYSTVASGLTAGNAYLLLNNSLTTGTILVSAEL
jgi:hypothetical protein